MANAAIFMVLLCVSAVMDFIIITSLVKVNIERMFPMNTCYFVKIHVWAKIAVQAFVHKRKIQLMKLFAHVQYIVKETHANYRMV